MMSNDEELPDQLEFWEGLTNKLMSGEAGYVPMDPFEKLVPQLMEAMGGNGG